MNAIDTLITLADVRGSLDLRCQFQGDWALEHDQEVPGKAPFHLVLSGRCRVELTGGQRLDLTAGDILVLPSGAAHLLLSRGRRVSASIPDLVTGSLLAIKRFGDGDDLDLLCGHFIYQTDSSLFASLPDHLLTSSNTLGVSDPLPSLVSLLRSEADLDQPGAQFVVNALTSALFALVMRAYLRQSPKTEGTLALLADKRLSRAWQAMLEDPARDWTTEALASLANMSRAAFLRSFTKLSGTSPGSLVTKVRMELACGLLSRSSHGLSDIAAQVGYQSQAAFSKVFKKTYGTAPGQFRRDVDG